MVLGENKLRGQQVKTSGVVDRIRRRDRLAFRKKRKRWSQVSGFGWIPFQ